MKAANALGGKTARACDSCLRRRARWFCAADDAFLCHSCDTLVHSANQLASRHERVRLQTASSSSSSSKMSSTHQTWHSGFTRKARTPRHNKHLVFSHHQQYKQHEAEEKEEEDVVFIHSHSCLPVVPELGSEDAVMMEESEEQLLCRVPEFDAAALETELCGMYGENIGDEMGMVKNEEEACDLDNFSEFLESDMDLAEFAADVESLLVDEESPQVFDCKQEEDGGSDINNNNNNTSMVKIKDEEEEEEVVLADENKKRKIFLRLNYEEVISAWDSQGCPWTTGNPPQLNSNDSLSDCLGWSGGWGGWWYGGKMGESSRGREARVTRYREKRRTRLFAKKIRYEVRKLNAEKRPRMKGRFVKRASFLGLGPNTTTPAALPPPPVSR